MKWKKKEMKSLNTKIYIYIYILFYTTIYMLSYLVAKNHEKEKENNSIENYIHNRQLSWIKICTLLVFFLYQWISTQIQLFIVIQHKKKKKRNNIKIETKSNIIRIKWYIYSK